MLPPRDQYEEDTKAYVLPLITGDHQLSENFRLGEFACRDGTPVVLVHPALVEHLQRLRNYAGGPVEVLSGFRTGAYNKKIGGVDNSRHMYGMAADVVVDGMTPEEVATWAEEEGFGGVGRYPNEGFTHLDVYGQSRRWTG